jgi:hypothetical protein
MPETTGRQQALLLITPRGARQDRADSEVPAASRGFGGGQAARAGKRKGGQKRSHALSKTDWGPLGKHPDLEAILARQRLHLPRSGRLTLAQVNQAWKRCAAEHHPDRGGAHDTMQLVNRARDLLLGRDLS